MTGKSIKLALRPENPNSGQRFRASGELEGDREPICPGLGSSSLHTSEMTYRSVDQFQPKRQGRRHGKGGLVAFFLYLVRVTSVDVWTVSTHPWCCSVHSTTYEALLSLNCQGVDVGCTWSALCWRGSGLYNL